MLKRLALAAVCLTIPCFGGCATVGSNPSAELDSEPEWLENLKALKGTGKTVGVSREAREIESRLGAH